jgi:nucleotide-binding universal stress UspA family protein
MDDQKGKRILVALDGSEGAFESVRYVIDFPPFREMGVTLFNVFSRIPESYWDLGEQPHVGTRVREIRAWQSQMETAMKEHMEKARHLLLGAGIPERKIKIDIRERKEGIARDILQAAGEGYEALLVGRRGTSKLKDLVLGSVANKLVEKLTFAPLVVVGKKRDSDKVLVALDGSEASEKSVELLVRFSKGTRLWITLLHVIRTEDEPYLKIAEERIEPVFERATNLLLEAGLPRNQLQKKVLTGVASRAGSILEEAKRGGFGTILVGRRGLSKLQEFFMGRVSNKVIQLAREGAVWVVS